jgi:putative ABC transport system permease protein
MLVKIATRNILRNRRRSSMAVLSLCIGAVAMLLFGAFMSSLILGLKTSTVASNGHLTIYRKGYLDYGSGSPGEYSIDGYRDVIAHLRQDPVLGPKINVITPRVSVFGIAANFDADHSKTFSGVGFVPSDRIKMQAWDEYGIHRSAFPPMNMSDQDATSGVIGVGLARILGLCSELHLDHCPSAAATKPESAGATAAYRDFSTLRDDDVVAGARSGMPRIDLLGATSGGAPNVVSLNVAGTSEQPIRDVDDSYVGMPLALAQQLLYGRGEHLATSIVIQLHNTADMGKAKARLATIFDDGQSGLEAHDFIELTPFYTQVIALFGSIFTFITTIMLVIVMFTVANTMGMTVIERTNEIGTVRAMGVRRSGIRLQFVVEGLLLGLIGATMGVVLAVAVSTAINNAGFHWLPPGQTFPVPLRMLIWAYPQLLAGTWIGLVVVAAIAALLPANKAARMTVVNALRHV